MKAKTLKYKRLSLKLYQTKIQDFRNIKKQHSLLKFYQFVPTYITSMGSNMHGENHQNVKIY